MIFLVGDSLAVGMEHYVPKTWKVDALGGRPMQAGAPIIRKSKAGVLVISLGTNNAPSELPLLKRTVRSSITAPHRCAVWSTIYRKGYDYSAFNRYLLRAHRAHPRRLQVAGWATRAARLVSDGVHPGPAGYRLRTKLYREAAARCPR